MNAYISIEIEMTLEGGMTRYHPATWDDPEEGGEVIDLDIVDATINVSKPKFVDGIWGWDRRLASIFEGVDRKNPEVIKIRDNILNAIRNDAEQAVVDEFHAGSEW